MDDKKEEADGESNKIANEDESKKNEEEKKEVAAPAVALADEEEIFCRFCWDSISEIQNPLLSVCKCSGGVGFVHYACLKHWLKTKMTE